MIGRKLTVEIEDDGKKEDFRMFYRSVKTEQQQCVKDPLGALARYGKAAEFMEILQLIMDNEGKLKTPPCHTEPQAEA